ncbi:MAG TPA: hypothetical protein VNF73_07160 [Candidatus Saccharimonadales bacterium]|nr:hypothetical protein [Candidatus Saccharimonadales bacterium]
MAGPPTPRGPLQGLQELNETIADHQPQVSTFLRGIVVGAFVGAAIAGSTLVRRWRQGRRQPKGD